MFDLTALANEVHAQNVTVGWWDDWEVKTDRHETAMMLVVSEIAEAMEGDRKDLMDDHLPEFKAFDVELADAMIRLLDLAGAYEITGLNNLDELVDRGFTLKSSYTITVPERLWRTITFIASQSGGRLSYKQQVIHGIVEIVILSKLYDFDIWKLVELKRAYNKERADHKRENRAAVGGKSY